MAQQLTSLSSQRGASVSGIVMLLIFIVIAGKLVAASVPAQIGDYQLTKTLSDQLRDANNNGDSPKQFMSKVTQQLSVNADYDTNVEEVFVFTNSTPGQLAIRKNYSKTNNLFANVDIVNRFEGDIEASAAK